MVNISIREAAKIYHVSRPTLTKALKDGKISGTKDHRGRWQIDPAELERVYQPRETKPDKDGRPQHGGFPTDLNALSKELDALKTRLAEVEQRAAVAEALAEERGQRIEDLRRMLPSPTQPRRKRWPWRRD